MRGNGFVVNRVDNGSALSKDQVIELMNNLPLTIDLRGANTEKPIRRYKAPVEVEHRAFVVYIQPPLGKRIYCATFTDREKAAEMHPDNALDEDTGVIRNCYHFCPNRLGVCGKNSDKEIEVDIQKYHRE